MKRLLIISFDYFREDEPKVPYAIACLRSAILHDEELSQEWHVEALSVDLTKEIPMTRDSLKSVITSNAMLDRYDAVAIGDYCWVNRYIADLLDLIKNWQPQAKILLGGYQVTSTPTEKLDHFYPPGRKPYIFLKGFGEESLRSVLRAISTGADLAPVYEDPINCLALLSPWTGGELVLGDTPVKVRWETKRGCIFKCDYCEFKSAANRPTKYQDMRLNRDRLLEEIKYFKSKNVKKVNVLDPLFNLQSTYEDLLEPMLSSGLHFSIQIRIELLQDDLLDAASGNRNLTFEIGVQTLDDELNVLLCRKNRMEIILEKLDLLRQRNVTFETNLIFGIPGQSVSMHISDIKKLISVGCPKKNILCFPLRIPRGSRLESRREEFEIDELPILHGDKLVQSAKAFDRIDWYRMIMLSHLDNEPSDGFERRAGLKTLSGADRLIEFGLWHRALDRFNFRLFLVDKNGTAKWVEDCKKLCFARKSRLPETMLPGDYFIYTMLNVANSLDSGKPEEPWILIHDNPSFNLSHVHLQEVLWHHLDPTANLLHVFVRNQL